MKLSANRRLLHRKIVDSLSKNKPIPIFCSQLITEYRFSLDNKKPAKPFSLRVYILETLVEAAGIEPASVSTPPQGLHAYPAL